MKLGKEPPVSSRWDLSAAFAREELLGGSLCYISIGSCLPLFGLWHIMSISSGLLPLLLCDQRGQCPNLGSKKCPKGVGEECPTLTGDDAV